MIKGFYEFLGTFEFDRAGDCRRRSFTDDSADNRDEDEDETGGEKRKRGRGRGSHVGAKVMATFLQENPGREKEKAKPIEEGRVGGGK